MRIYVRKEIIRKKPFSARLRKIDIELTERCNNNCIHCCINLPADDRAARKREMSTDQVKAVLTEAAELGCMRVRFTGGEPLLRPDFNEIYLFARRLGMKVKIFTNATLITEELASLLASIPPLVALEVTAYGMRPESYEAVTGLPGSFERFRRGLDLLAARQIPFYLKSALLPPNRHELEEFEAWAGTLSEMKRRPPSVVFYDLRCRRDDEEKNHLIKSLRLSPQENIAILARDDHKFRSGMEKFAEKYLKPSGERIFACGAGKSLCIDAYGWAQPCVGVRHPDLCPDLFSGEVAKPLTAALKQMAALRDMKAANPAYLERCANCFLQALCDQCPAKSWSEHGTLDTPVEYCCQIAHARAYYMGWLAKGEKAWLVTDWKKYY